MFVFEDVHKHVRMCVMTCGDMRIYTHVCVCM